MSAPDPADLGELADLAERAAREAGALALRLRTEGVSVAGTKSTPTDVVTEGDTAAERLLRERLLGARPHDGLLGEESAEVGGSSGVRWVVDPVDGTVNYLYGLPAWAVSVAAELDGQLVVGVVHQPAAGETWVAVRGAGARLNGRPVRATECNRLDRALVGTGFGYAADRRARQAELLREVLPAVRDIRRAGAASLDLACVGGGRLDAYYERGLKPWDLAAGRLVALEGGAQVTGLGGRTPGEDLVVASAPGVHDALLELLERLDADRD